MSRRCLAVLTVCILLSSMARAQENWESSEGLELWLSADHEAASRGNKFKTGSPIAVWHDQSPHKRHVQQAEAGQQPVLMQVPGTKGGTAWVLRFDGTDDVFRALETGLICKEFTLFLVAAPHSNAGFFRGFFAANAPHRRDYESGWNVDLNSPPSGNVQDINIEGAGFGGARNLLKAPHPFGSLKVLEVVADAQSRKVSLMMDGQPQGEREYQPRELNADELTVGARYYDNTAAPQRAQGHMAGDIAEVVLFSRALPAEERKQIREALEKKYAPLREALAQERKLAQGANVEVLKVVENAPPVQMLVPGFEVEELPVQLNNLNNLRYRPDGKLYALGYDGDVWLLSDTDSDGREDKSERFFENNGRLRGPIGMQVIPAGHKLLEAGPKAQGVVVASKGKISALLDNDGDNVAEEERVIAWGWQEITQNVDAIGVAIDKAGAIYFGLGCAAYNNAYLLNDAGKSQFDLASERGTIQKIEPDLSKRSTVCTGVRFTIGMEFNEQGDLFCSEQEGATWLPNGNPFDELLHIQPGKHYGFPPRHPRHLPNVFDEPSLFDYGPQHQSTCGMCFNVPFQSGGPTFGPEAWRGDLLVTGESRGKLYRTRLIRHESSEYTAQNELIGCLGMLTVDCCLTPRGDLLICCHSGGPDWGTGPKGVGKIYRVRYTRPEAPQPLLAWAATPREVRVVFDKPLKPEHLSQLTAKSSISYGAFVAAGDRFETIRPGYAVTAYQQSVPRFKLPILSASVTADRQTLLLATEPHELAVNYALTLPGLGRPERTEASFSQEPQVDLAYSLQGVEAHFTPLASNLRGWQGWLPSVDLEVSKRLTAGSAEHDELWKLVELTGVMNLKANLYTEGLFEPLVQPNSQLDYPPAEDTFVTERKILVADSVEKEIVVPANHAKFIPVELTIWTNSRGDLNESPKAVTGTPRWEVKLADGSTRSGLVPLHRFLVPWAKQEVSADQTPIEIPELAGGSWGRGRQLFFSDAVGCAKCHSVGRQGGQIGPDLSNLIHRDYASVSRDISKPSFAINPDFITFAVGLKDGRVITGTVKNDGEVLVVGDKEGKVTQVQRSDIEEMVPQAISTMPDDIHKKLSHEQFTDLLTYLLTPAPLMPRDAPLPRPEPRKAAEVTAALAGSETLDPKTFKPLHILLVGGAKDHGPGEHDYPAWVKNWKELLRAADHVSVDTAMEWPTANQIAAADVIAFFQKGQWNAERATAIDAHLKAGKGLVYIHWAVNGDANAPEFAQRIGLATTAGGVRYRHGPLELGFETGSQHPIGRNFDKVHFHDESYWKLSGDPRNIQLLASSVEEGESWPQFWTIEPKGGRVFVSIPGHYSWTFDDPLFRILLLRGMAWSANEPVDRFNPLVTLGVELQ